MGADLLVMSIHWTQKKKEKPEKGFQTRCAQIDCAIDRITRIPHEDRLMDINPDYQDTWAELPTVDEYKQYLYDLVDELRKAWGARDTAFLQYGDQRVFLTGGMSWGDSPGETFDLLTKLSYAGVL